MLYGLSVSTYLLKYVNCMLEKRLNILISKYNTQNTSKIAYVGHCRPTVSLTQSHTVPHSPTQSHNDNDNDNDNVFILHNHI